LVESLASQQCGQVAQLLEAEIVSCVKAGLLRSFDVQLIAYTVMAVSAYEPLVYGLLYGNDRSVDVMKLLERVFMPLMTTEGERQLKSYLRGAASVTACRTRAQPSLGPQRPARSTGFPLSSSPRGQKVSRV
jgi:hypothetical protein